MPSGSICPQLGFNLIDLVLTISFGSVLSDCPLPAGGFYLWIPAPDGDAWGLTERLAREAGALISPGEFYGADGAPFVRVAVVQPDDRVRLVAERLRKGSGGG